ncbi:putative HTH lysR-type domain-containing protein [Paraburkholderia unamae]|uniref:LysR family transcriptional regulator n=1 Tax=Paraburkholderia unamae TaxID=219649 RepID=UPI000DC22AE5|nr:LysR substrate-binding domain-containing protein [Paraburkholderia unamae]RAR66106.1 DNA-binding transcriptional LysR family regulator [Paraburkholderia unamae]CAG9271631.1 putative HTH lysR-type domain-containing protein [Paraburkholderia unamae]
MLIDPRHLIQLHMIVELGSFISAAERLGLTQPGLSRNIRLLESRIGVRLLIRGKHGAVPTDEGKTLAAYGRRLFELSQQAATTGAAVHRGEVGELRLGAAFSLANGLIAEPVSRFLAARPKTSLRVLPGPTPRLLEELDAGQLDLVVGGTQMLPEEHGLRFEALVDNDLVAVGRADHPLAKLEHDAPVAQLREYRWVACLEQDPLRRDVEAGMASLGLTQDCVALETASLTLVTDVLARTDFLTLIPSPLANALTASGRFARVQAASSYTLRPIGVAYRVNAYIPPIATAFIKVLRGWAQENRTSLAALRDD